VELGSWAVGSGRPALIISMLHRIFNRGGQWYRPAHLDAKKFQNFDFAINWTNLNKMFSLRQYYTEIAPPFSKTVAHRVAEIEQLHDDISFYHVRRSWYMFFAWVFVTTFFIDFEAFETPARHWRNDAQQMWPHGKLRATHHREEK